MQLGTTMTLYGSGLDGDDGAGKSRLLKLKLNPADVSLSGPWL